MEPSQAETQVCAKSPLQPAHWEGLEVLSLSCSWLAGHTTRALPLGEGALGLPPPSLPLLLAASPPSLSPLFLTFSFTFSLPVSFGFFFPFLLSLHLSLSKRLFTFT